METALNQPMLWVETLFDQWETALCVSICFDNQVALKVLQAAINITTICTTVPKGAE
jgi:hypothetical protein